MKKAQLNEIVLRFLAATPRVIVGARDHAGTCKFCGSPKGIQHTRACPTWGLIHARIECHLFSESPTRPNEVEPDCVMATLESGDRFAANEPAPALIHSATAIDKRRPA